jgi:hypothetical protein
LGHHFLSLPLDVKKRKKKHHRETADDVVRSNTLQAHGRACFMGMKSKTMEEDFTHHL